MQFKVGPMEAAILRDIEARTGLSFMHLDGIDTCDRSIAEAVLPVLKEWVPLVREDNIRGGLYHRFGTANAHPHLDSLIEWWKHESEKINAGTLTWAIVQAAKPADGERLWKLCQELPPKPGHYALLAKLATFPAVEREVKDRLVEALEHLKVQMPRRFDDKLIAELGPLTPEERKAKLQLLFHEAEEDESLTVGDVQHISQVNDPRIRKWFEGQVNSPNPGLRLVARRAVKRGKRLPRGVWYADHLPDRRAEIFSTEVDLEELRPFLAQLAKEIGLEIPAPVRTGRFLDRIDVDRWVVAPTQTTQGEPAELWFRLEDVDVVEIAAIRGDATPRG